MIVCKFGGSITANATSIKNINELLENKERKILVFSAIGKSDKNDIKLTDLLIDLYNQLNAKEDYENTLKKILNKLNKIIKELNINFKLNVEINRIKKKLKNNLDYDYLISRGEYLTTKIISQYLSIPFVDAGKIMFVDKKIVNYNKISIKINYYLKKYNNFATSGFYAINNDKKIQLFSRGGGDITGAIIAKSLNNCLYENWTDIDGIYEINPQIKKSKIIEKLSYKDADLITKFDACVLNNECVEILKKTSVKLFVKNGFNHNANGTLIEQNCSSNYNFVVRFQKNGIDCVLVKCFNKDKFSKLCNSEMANIIETYYPYIYVKIQNFDAQKIYHIYDYISH